jgi:hypothetical protein
MRFVGGGLNALLLAVHADFQLAAEFAQAATAGQAGTEGARALETAGCRPGAATKPRVDPDNSSVLEGGTRPQH